MFTTKIKLFVLCFALCVFLAGCTGQKGEWHPEYVETETTGHPHNMAPGFYSSEYGELVASTGFTQNEERIKTVAVLLPLSGNNAILGTGIQRSIEIAFFQKQPSNILVSFNDLSGTAAQKTDTIDKIIARQPDIIIGPIFSEDVNLLKRAKPDTLPAIAFTSDASVLGDGIFTFALLPNQGVEAIVKHMATRDNRRLLILAPNTKAGHMLANSALESASIHGVRPVGLYYYLEGDMANMKSVAEKASMFKPRESANKRAKEIMADVLMSHNLNSAEKTLASQQLEALNKADTVGRLPYDAVLFLGGPHDSKALASFLRYFDVPTNTVRFYGTAMWDADSMFGDLTLNGAEFASLSPISKDFTRIYTDIEGIPPNRMNSMGYDAAMLAIGALSGNKSSAAHLLDPSGYNGLDGLIRLRPNGHSERALQIMRLNASGTPRVSVPAATNFIIPLYQTPPPNDRKPYEIYLTHGFNALDYIQLPTSAEGKYRSTTYRLSGVSATKEQEIAPHVMTMLPEDDSDETIFSDPDFQPNQMDVIDRRIIEDVEIRVR
ncbi:MAG: penicillin-binding protein activator [Alphaproteobacteria bacterium]|nr:penicillin-binding protein activator [Alphaproteobacteria bacterium]